MDWQIYSWIEYWVNDWETTKSPIESNDWGILHILVLLVLLYLRKRVLKLLPYFFLLGIQSLAWGSDRRNQNRAKEWTNPHISKSTYFKSEYFGDVSIRSTYFVVRCSVQFGSIRKRHNNITRLLRLASNLSFSSWILHWWLFFTSHRRTEDSRRQGEHAF